MAEFSQENTSRRDLGGPSGVPPEVVEFLGVDNVVHVEVLSDTLLVLKELSCRQDPFTQPGCKLLSPELNQLINELAVAGTQPSHYPDASQAVARRAGPILGEAVKSTKGRLVDIGKNSRDEMPAYQAASEEIEDLAGYISTAPKIFDQLERLAGEMPEHDLKKAYSRLTGAELDALNLDSLVTMFIKDPSTLVSYKASLNAASTARRTGWERDAKRSEHSELKIEIRVQGGRQKEVKKSHRKAEDVYKDFSAQDLLVDAVEDLRSIGSQLHENVRNKGGLFMAEPAAELFNFLVDLKYGRLMGDEMRVHLASGDNQQLVNAAAAEKYIAEMAVLAEAGFRQSGFKIDKEFRRTMAELKDAPINRGLRRVASHAMAQVEKPYASLEADQGFRRQCREVRDIVVGGGRWAFRSPLGRKTSPAFIQG